MRKPVQPAIEAVNLTKAYGPFTAVGNLSFTVSPGQVVALAGPGGAGKSTTVRLLTACTAPSVGTASIDGFDVHEHRLAALARVGYLPQSGSPSPRMTPIQLLRLFGEARGLERGFMKKRLSHVIDLCGIEDVLERPIGRLSKALALGVGLAQALLHDPKVLVLDEPTVGLDASQHRAFRRLVEQLRGKKTLLITMSEARGLDALLDRVIVLRGGRHSRTVA